MIKDQLRSIIEVNDTKWSRGFDLFIQGLIFVSLITFSVDTLPDLSSDTKAFLNGVEIFCVIIFTIEYVLRLWLSERTLKFVFSFFGIIDLLAILPFYLSFGIDLRSIRALRFIRLVRVLKLARYSSAVDRFGKAFLEVRNEIVIFSLMTMVLLYLSAVGIYFFEHDAQPDKFSSVFESLWWSVATLTTVGYGDIYPVTVGGRIFTFFILIIGLGIVSVPAGLIASAFSKDKPNSEE